MNQVPLTDTLRIALADLDQPTEIVDDSGRKIGYYLPHELYRQLLVGWSEAVVPADEIERRAAEPGEGRSAADIFATLEQGRELRR